MTRVALAGRTGSPGTGLGRLLQVRPTRNGRSADERPDDGRSRGTSRAPDPAAERVRLEAALAKASDELEGLARTISERAGDEIGAIFEAQALFARDPGIVGPALQSIAAGSSADAAILASTEEHAQRLAAVDDPYFRARAADLRDVGNRIAGLIRGSAQPDLWHVDGQPAVIVADDLDPSAVATLRRELVAGIALAGGAPTGHSVIVARGLGIPLVLGLGPMATQMPAGREGLVDGRDAREGRLIVDPDADDLASIVVDSTPAPPIAGSWTGHGDVRIAITANVGSVLEAEAAAREGADGIGLVRTELLFLSRTTPPSIAEQRHLYKGIRAAIGQRPAVFRTLDVGGDKPAAWQADRPEANPALGVRGVRLGLARPNLLDDQLVALLQAADGAETRIMLPMVATAAEVAEVRRRLDALHAQLRMERPADGRDLGIGSVRLGVMVEVPAAALVADGLAEVADFFSIGTNDLVQYTMAADRTNASMADLATPLQPAVLRLIERVVTAARAHQRHVAVCGEAAADPEMIPLLVGLGVDELSVAPASIAAVRLQTRSLSQAACRELATAALLATSVDAVRSLVHSHRVEHEAMVAE